MDRETEVRNAVTEALDAIDGDRSALDLVEEIPLLEAITAEIAARRVAATRAQGLSWEAIAIRLGTTRQAAHKRFGKPPKKRKDRRGKKETGGTRLELRIERSKRQPK